MDENIKKSTFIGVVEDNKDPSKLNRCKVRVIGIFEDIDVEDIPWASPWKDLNGNSINVPDVGKVVSVVFNEGNRYSPEYIYAEHFNINLENKLKNLSGKDYVSMKALLFDHKTQIYVNDSEGLKLDHKMNNINIVDGGINLNLKDNKSKINIGTENSTQQAILGNNFFKWLDELVNILGGSEGGPYLGNLGAPLVPTPALTAKLIEYQTLKPTKFLSHNVNIVDNNYVEKINREANPQLGDEWRSTKIDNSQTTNESVDFKSKYGNSDDPIDNTQVSENPDVLKLISLMNSKSYTIYDERYKLNIVGVRNSVNGSVYNNQYNDELYVFYKNDNNVWEIKKYRFSTIPGYCYLNETDENIISKKKTSITNKQSKNTTLNKGFNILLEAQYVNSFVLYKQNNSDGLKLVSDVIYTKDNSLSDIITYGERVTGNIPNLFIKKGKYDNLINNDADLGNQLLSGGVVSLFKLCEKHKSLYGNFFTYTLVKGSELQ